MQQGSFIMCSVKLLKLMSECVLELDDTEFVKTTHRYYKNVTHMHHLEMLCLSTYASTLTQHTKDLKAYNFFHHLNLHLPLHL